MESLGTALDRGTTRQRPDAVASTVCSAELRIIRLEHWCKIKDVDEVVRASREAWKESLVAILAEGGGWESANQRNASRRDDLAKRGFHRPDRRGPLCFEW